MLSENECGDKTKECLRKLKIINNAAHSAMSVVCRYVESRASIAHVTFIAISITFRNSN